MNTKRLVVDRLRGIDQRYYTRPEAAAIIEEMSWDSYDGWRAAGGCDLVTQDLYDWATGYFESTLENYRITSIHVYSRGPNFNEILFETSLGELCKLNIGNMKKSSHRSIDMPFDFIIDEFGFKYDGLCC